MESSGLQRLARLERTLLRPMALVVHPVHPPVPSAVSPPAAPPPLIEVLVGTPSHRGPYCGVLGVPFPHDLGPDY